MYAKTTMSHATMNAIHCCNNAQAVHSYTLLVTHSNDDHFLWWVTCPLNGKDPLAILMHSQCIHSVHTYARHDELIELCITFLVMHMVAVLTIHSRTLSHSLLSLWTQCELLLATIQANVCAHPMCA